MTGRIPKYGANFRLETRLPYDPSRDFAARRYVVKSNPKIWIRSTRNSEHWMVFVGGPAGAAFPVGTPFDTLGQAMPAALALAEKIAEGS